MFIASLPPRIVLLVLALFAVDGLFIGFDTFVRALKFFGLVGTWELHNYLSVETERGPAEFFNYFKVGLIVAVLALTYLKSRVLPCLIIALFFVFAGLDDSFQIHERVGEALAMTLGLGAFAGLSGESVGQLVFFSAVGGGLLTACAIAWVFADALGRRIFLVFLPLFAALAFFAAVVDSVRDANEDTLVLYSGLGLIEDSGEMVVVTVACAVAFGVFFFFKETTGKKTHRAARTVGELAE